MRERSIIHINVADFAVAVERSADSRLRDRPVIIAHEGAARAAVYDMSDESYQIGVRKGMTLRRALRCCRDAIVLPPRPDRYERAMARLLKHALPYSPLIEVTDHNGHLFVDTTGTGRLFGPPPDVAWRIRKAVRSDMGFDPMWSVAPNKLMAKVATRTVKPTGEYIVRAGDEGNFLKPLPVHLIPGIEREDLQRFREFNLTRVGHVANLSMGQLDIMFGRRSRSLHDAVRGIDPSPVYPIGQKQPIVSVDHEFGPDTNDVAVLEGALYQLIERAGAELRKRGLTARRSKIVLDYSDGARIARQAVSNPPTANDASLFAAAALAFDRAWIRRVRIRRLGLTCDRLTYPPAQMELFPEYKEEEKKSDALIAALDKIRFRFGFNAVRMGKAFSVFGADVQTP
jgi:DNA polymerase-4